MQNFILLVLCKIAIAEPCKFKTRMALPCNGHGALDNILLGAQKERAITLARAERQCLFEKIDASYTACLRIAKHFEGKHNPHTVNAHDIA